MPDRRGALSAVLIMTMIASTLQIFAIAVLASSIIGDLGVSRTSLGAIGAVNTGVGALTAPLSGRFTDRIGPRRAVLSVLGLAAVGMALMAMSSSVWLLVVSGLILGVPQGWSNPATNTLISTMVPVGERGLIMGVKQSGVTLAVVLAGFTLPWLEGLHNWRFAVGVYAVLFAISTMVAAALLPGGQRVGVGGPNGTTARVVIAPLVKVLTIYALLMGLASGAIARWLPLFAEEDIGWSQEFAGALLATAGVVGIVARVIAARRAELGDPLKMLQGLALIGLMSSVLITCATIIGGWVLWPMVLLYGVGYTAWNAVINLTVVMSTPAKQAGRSSGVLMLGFLGGLTIAAPLAGWVVDTWDSYVPVWGVTVVLSGTSALLLTGRRAGL